MPIELKGYLFVQPHKQFLKARNVPFEILDEEIEMPKKSFEVH